MVAISRPLKVYFLPFLAQGHMIPSCQFARLFAARGLHVTIITTPVNARFLETSIEESRALGHHIQLHTIRFPSEEVGLPVGIENFFNVTDARTADKFYVATALLQNQVQPFMEQNPPDCIVSDFIYPWTAPIATRLGIPRIVFNSFCLFAVCMVNARKRQSQSNPELYHDDHDGDSDSGGPFVVSGVPDPVTLTLRPPKLISHQLETLIEADQKNSYGLIVNSFSELEGQDYIKYYQKIADLKVWHIGPASLMLRNILPQKDLHQQTNNDHEHIKTWLDSKERNSVVYVSFGSLCRFDDPQLLEIACGLESSGCCFIWVVHRESKQNKYSDEDEENDAWLPVGFEERMEEEGRGLILMKWAPQELILNHRATGGFLTHCGWTSVTEAVSAGVPMMTWPVFIEQFYNEKLITQVQGFGVEVGAEEWKSSPYERMKKVVSREKIEKAVRRLMDGGDAAEDVRKKAREMREKARKAVEEDGSSQRDLTALIEDLKLIGVSQAQNGSLIR